MIQEKRRLWKLILLSIVTLGIYDIVFWYKFVKDLNTMNQVDKRLKNYILVIFLSIITLGIYHWVWLFYLADRVQITGIRLGVKVRTGPGAVLAWNLFGSFVLIGPLVARLLLILNMNKLAKAYNIKNGYTQETVQKKRRRKSADSEETTSIEKNPEDKKSSDNKKDLTENEKSNNKDTSTKQDNNAKKIDAKKEIDSSKKEVAATIEKK